MLSVATKSFLILLLLLTFPIPLSAQQQKTAEAVIAEARALRQKGEQWRAVDKLREAIALDPNNAAIHTELADLYLAMKENDSARKAVAEALRLNPNYPQAHHRNAVLLRLAGDYERSISEARAALSLNPDDDTTVYSHVTIARSLVKLKKFTEADEEFRKAVSVFDENVKQKPNEASAHAALGDLLFQLQDYDRAENAYRRALQLDPKDSSIALTLTYAIDNQGKRDEAIRSYQEYLRLNPDDANKAKVEARMKWLETNTLPTITSYLLINAAENGKLSNVRNLIAKGANVNFRDGYKTPLYTASAGGYLEVVKVLLDQGAKDDDGYALATAYEEGHTQIEDLLDRGTPKPLTPKTVNRLLLAALRKGDTTRFAGLVDRASQEERDELLLYALSQIKQPRVELIRLLLERGANVNQPTTYKTPLMYAASEGQAETVKLLLDKGAQVNVQTGEGTALMMAVVGGNPATVKLLLAAGADVKATHRIGDQALIMAARREVQETKSTEAEPGHEIMQMLLEKGANPNARGAWERTALMFANTPAKVDLLVRNRADVEAKDKYGETALMNAASRGDAAVVSALISHGADVNSTDQKGDTALLRSLDDQNRGYSKDDRKLIDGRVEAARRILQTKGVNVDVQNTNGETALMRAVRLENIEMVRSLLPKVAEVNRADVFGDTATTIAYAKANGEIEKLLTRPSSVKGQPLNVLNAFLRAAISRKDEAFVKELLNAGANPNHEYGIGYTHNDITRTMLVSAALVGHPGIVKLLLDKGANVNAKGLIYGSESGLKYGTALEAAEFANHTEVAAILRKAMNAR